MVILLIMVFLVFSRIIRTNRSRKLLESDILSIHSCAVVWRLTLIAHARSLRMASIDFSLENTTTTVDAYMFARQYLDCLQQEIDTIKANAHDPSQWLQHC